MLKSLPITGNRPSPEFPTQRNSNRCFRILLLLMACCSFGLWQPAWAQIGYNISGPTAGNLLRTSADNITTGATKILAYNAGSASTNVWSASQTLPFAFNFYGTAVTNYVVNKNGLLSFDASLAGANVATNLNVNTALPNTNLPANAVAYFWGDFVTLSASDDIWSITYGTAPNRQHWVFSYSLTIDAVTFAYNAVVFEETTNKIYFVDMYNNPGGTFTVGVQQNATTAAQVAASPNLALVNTGTANSDNDYYAFEPYVLPANDLGIIDITAPATGCGKTATEAVTVQIKNFGAAPQSNFPVTFSVSGPTNTALVTETVTATIAAGATLNYTFTGTANLAAIGNYNITAATALSGDATPANNNRAETIFSYNALNGTYTINSANPTSATNFTNFTDAATALNTCGITGPVVFNVAAGSGPYTEQIVLNQITGASATNTVTFNGNGRTIQADPQTGTPAVITLNGTDYTTITNLTIETTGNTTSSVGWGIHLLNGADNNTISSNTITIGSLSTTESNSVGIAMASSTTSITTTGGNNGNNNVISGNTITGAYKGLHLHGVPTNPGNNQVINNIIKDFYSEGIEVNGLNATLVEGNTISRPTRATVGSFYGIYLAGDAQNSIISKNRITNSHGAATSLTGNVFGIYSNANDAPSGSENIVINNLVYGINNTTGNINGLYNSGSNGVYYYHNTIVLDNPNHTGIARGLYQTTTASNIRLFNNNISITTAGTAANLQAIYLNTAATVLTSNNNNLYVPTGNIGYATSDKATLADWQAANTTAPYDLNSVSVNPFFVNTSAGNFQPTNGGMNNIGQPLTAVTTDITGATRNTTNPDPGAYEFTPAALDLGTLALTAPVIKSCYSAAEQVSVAIKNFGGAAVDFSTNNATVSVTVTGPGSPTTITLNLNNNSLNGGQPLASGDTLIVPVGTVNMSAAGNYVFNANIAVTSGGTDGNTSNNAISPVTRVVNALAAGTASISSTNYCAGFNITLNLAGNTGGNIQWQQATSASGPFTNIAGATSATFAIASVPQTTYYQAVVSCGSNSLTSNIVNITANTVTTTGATRCGYGPVTLSATTASGTIDWYDQPTGGQPLASGNTYSPTVFNTKTFYAAGSAISSTVTIGRTRSSTSGATNLNTGIIFSANATTRIDSVKIYPIGTGAGTVKIILKNAAGQRLDSVTVNVTGTAAPGIRTNVPLGFVVQPGTGYKLAVDAYTGLVTSLARESSGSAFPYNVPQNNFALTGSQLQTNTVSTSTYYFFYEWSVRPSCQTARIPAVATVTPATQFSVAGSRTTCSNSSTTLTASSTANYTYTWSPATGLNQTTGATVIANPRVTTSYVVIGTDGTCSDVDTITVTVTPIAAGFTTGFAALCTGDSTWLSLQGSAGNIQWQRYNGTAWVNETSTGATTAFYKIQPTQTSQYRAFVSNGTCTPVISDTVNVAVGLPTIVASAPATNCGPGTVTLSATPSNGDMIQWFSAATGGTALASGNTFSPNVTATTTYYAEAGRFSNEGKVGPANNAIGAGGYGNFSNQMVFTALQPLRIDFVTLYSDGPMSFKVYLRDTVDGNFLDSSTVILPGAGQHRVPLGFEVMPGTNYAIGIPNFSGSGQLYRNTAGTAFPYTLPGVISITGSNFSPTTARYYYFYDWSVSTIGCTSARTAVTATVNPVPVVNLGADTIACGTAAITLNAGNAGATFEWSLNGTVITTATTQTYTATAAGTYVVNITSAAGCTATDTIVVTVNQKPATPTITASGNSGQELTSSATTGNQWFLNGQPISGATAQTYQTTANGAYTVVVTDNSCTSDTSAAITITNTGIKDALAGMSVNVYPNPSNGKFSVKLSGYKQDAALELYSLTGQLIVKEEVKAGQDVTQMQVKNLAAGTYLLKVISEKGVQINKVVVE